MKTAVSMPDAVYDRITRSAAELGLSRSELLARAATSYLDQLEADSLTARINAALEQVGPDNEVEDIVAAGKRQILDSDEDW
jgi:metal-responsive CopG/Arc/MetJ family transcriptional regulator